MGVRRVVREHMALEDMLRLHGGVAVYRSRSTSAAQRGENVSQMTSRLVSADDFLVRQIRALDKFL